MKKENESKAMRKRLSKTELIDIWPWTENKTAITKTCALLMEKIKNLKLDGYKLSRIEKHLKLVLLNLYIVHEEDPRKYLIIPARKSDYTGSERLGKLFLSYKYMMFIVDYLRNTDNKYNHKPYVDYVPAIHTPNYSKRARMKASQELLRMFKRYETKGGKISWTCPSIKLKDKDGKEIGFDGNDREVKRLIQEIDLINKKLDDFYKIEVMVKEDELEDLLKRGVFNRDSNHYRRIFCRGDFEHGGRLYGHFTQRLRKEQRKRIFIDKQETCEIDFHYLHPTMLYKLAGLELPEGDLYQCEGVDEKYRNLYKKMLNIAINASTETKAKKALAQYNKDFYKKHGELLPKPTEILENLKEKHKAISQYFGQDCGVLLQRTDSDIAVAVMLDLFRRNICCLCIHDSFIVAKKYENDLKEAMIKHFKGVFDFEPKLEVTYGESGDYLGIYLNSRERLRSVCISKTT